MVSLGLGSVWFTIFDLFGFHLVLVFVKFFNYVLLRNQKTIFQKFRNFCLKYFFQITFKNIFLKSVLKTFLIKKSQNLLKPNLQN
jgi:hypothetical protein